jgi:hypothetical protein
MYSGKTIYSEGKAIINKRNAVGSRGTGSTAIPYLFKQKEKLLENEEKSSTCEEKYSSFKEKRSSREEMS